MSDSTPLKPSAGAASAFAAGAGVRVLFIAVICLSAFLLFLVQPMFAKMALPLLGGAPAVWTTAMLFFQAILLAGYAYAHWITSRLHLKWQLQVHLAITAVAALALPIAIPAGWTPPADDSSASLWLLALFTASLGAPFFALSANAPLLQKWYAATGGRDADDPYFLYAASNIGSFGALLAFPFLLEPLIGVREQSAVWTLGFCLLMVGLAVAGLTARRAMPAEAMVRESAAPTATDRPDWRRVLLWIGLAFVPSSMMLSVTAKIATDLGSFPLIWVTTLALYLLTYVFAFSNSFRAKARALPMVHMVLVLVAIFVALLNPGGALSHGKIGLYMVLLFVTALAFHSKLADARPSERHLTAFYLAMSAGGALGGLFNSVLGPMVFNDIYEFPVVLALAFFAGPAGLIAWRRDLPMAAGLGAAVLAAAWFGAANSETDPKLASTVFLVGIVASLAVLYLWRGYPLRQMMGAAVVIAGFSTVLSAGNVIYQERSFFGVYRVVDLPEDNLRLIYHDTTIHGMLKKTDGRPVPAGYYDPVGPFGQYFRMLEDDSDVGIVGLGAGGLACYRPDPMSMTFYEIDPTVDRIARNTALFPMLDRCAPETATVIGDARIRIADAGERIHDHLLLDAFSSDAVPVHLLTKEAFDLYDRAITPGGTIFVHISNRYFMLDGPVARVAQAAGFATFTQHFSPTEKQREEDLVAPSIALIATKNPDRIAALEADPQWRRAPGWDGPVWTDDYANTLSALR